MSVSDWSPANTKLEEVRIAKAIVSPAMADWVKEHSASFHASNICMVIISDTVAEKLPVPQHFEGEERKFAGEFLDLLEAAHRQDFDMLWLIWASK